MLASMQIMSANGKQGYAALRKEILIKYVSITKSSGGGVSIIRKKYENIYFLRQEHLKN
jgi:hypothetical protein